MAAQYIRPYFAFYILEDLIVSLSAVDIIIDLRKYNWCLPKGHKVQFFMKIES